MKCRKIAKQLPAYLANELSEQARSRVDAHLKHCALCRAELGAFERTDQLLGTLGKVEPKRDLVALTVRHIEREQETVPAFQRFLTSLRERQTQLRYAAANILLVLFVAVMLYNYQVRRHARVVPDSPIFAGEVAGPTGTATSGRSVTEFTKPVRLIRRWLVRPIRRVSTGDQARPKEIRVPLTPRTIAELNRDLERARSGDASDGGDWTPEGNSGVLRVGAPLILSPAPGGTLVVKPDLEAIEESTHE